MMMIMMKVTSHHQGRNSALDPWSVGIAELTSYYTDLFRIIRKNQRKLVKFILAELVVK